MTTLPLFGHGHNPLRQDDYSRVKDCTTHCGTNVSLRADKSATVCLERASKTALDKQVLHFLPPDG
jgi:hypothetical protein